MFDSDRFKGTMKSCLVLAVLVGLGLMAAAWKSQWFGLVTPGKQFPLQPTDTQLIQAVLADYQARKALPTITIDYPQDETLFPPEIIAPTFRWTDTKSEADLWLVSVAFQDGPDRINALVHASQWTPDPKAWESIKRRSIAQPAEVTIVGVRQTSPTSACSLGRVTIRTSSDEVAASIFFREVPLPFLFAYTHMDTIKWRLGDIASYSPPRTVLENMKVCGNCHSFSADGKMMGMDVDYANDKGAYAILPIGREMILSQDNIITWSDYRREDKDSTFGLLSQISPAGRYVVSTVKDRSIFVPRPDLFFSQLFFPLKGILVVYDRQTGKFASLPGADDPQLVQSNPSWSPDGKHILFARTKAKWLSGIEEQSAVQMPTEFCQPFLDGSESFQYDLYRIPFNEGRGGHPVPLTGASSNGKSNYFGRYSPDGRWIVFCQAKSFMLLQPDSELYIIPAEGGQPRRMRCNMSRMNSWHSWSPNGKWMVFAAKPYSAYTQLFLTHIDERGNDSPPVLLGNFTGVDRAANIPEFVPTKPETFGMIHEQFMNAYSYLRIGNDLLITESDSDKAEAAFRKALELEPNNVRAHCDLGLLLVNNKRFDEAIVQCVEALRLEPNNAEAHGNMGIALVSKRKFDEAFEHFNEALRLDPGRAETHVNLANALVMMGSPDAAIQHLIEALRLKPENADIHNNMGRLLADRNKLDEAIKHYTEALRINPNYAEAHCNLGISLARKGSFAEATEHFMQSLRIKPDSAETHSFMGFMLIQMGKNDEAIQHLLTALGIKPDYAPAHNSLGIALARQGQFDEALRHFAEALRLMPGYLEAQMNMGEALEVQGRLDEAIAHYKEAIRLAPDNAAVQAQLNNALQKRNMQQQGAPPHTCGFKPLSRGE